ncbi:hypothetical protein J8F10_21400 [Gemmata sp. G18]|uniref:Uncharacterized protein n=1 Tax=Gemmata palustris TaxID=2822762 RepID=A0ABS5BVR7_9BACT|nr:hypothetical protein [Gemmata palustris]MBP3957817.1 hypothetical protein [Gemmata palustris]
MRADDFLRAAVEWVAIRDAVRAVYPAEKNPFYTTVCGMYRELAWCHVLFHKGQYVPVVTRLRAIGEGALNIVFPAPVPMSPSQTEVIALAAEVRASFRSAVVARYPAAFDQFGRPKTRFRRSA